MEEKERYYSVIDCNEDFVIRDCESNQTCKSLFEVKTLLNYQNREINRLTKMLYTTTKHADKLNEENNKLNKENQKLKQQLHDSPKKIVEEIKDCLLDFSNGWWRYFMTDGCEYMLSSDLQGCLDEIIDTILKKYRGEDE